MILDIEVQIRSLPIFLLLFILFLKKQSKNYDMDHLIFQVEKNSANSRSIVFRFGQKIDDTKSLRLYGNMSSTTNVLYVLNDSWTIDSKGEKG
jgi:hypothetical protein